MTAMAFVLPIGYEENDDVVMCMIANGSYSGTPDAHLVFINVIYGALLAWLYSLTTAIEWYTLAFVVLHVLSMTVIVYCLLTTPNRAPWERVIWLLVMYVLWARVIVALQFTTTAGMVCLAGCMMLLRGGKLMRWGGAGMVVVASLIRFAAAGLVGLLMAPIIVYTQRLQWRRYIPVVLMLIAVVCCRGYNRHVYDSNPEWRYYREYNQLRAQLNDNPNAYLMRENQLPEGVAKEDYELLMRFMPDPEQINLPVIRQLSAIVGAVPFKQQLKNLQRMEKYIVEISILLALLVLMIITTGNRDKQLFLIIYTLFIIALIVHVSLDGYLKNRVFLCMLAPMLITDFMLLPKTTGRKRSYALGLAMTVLSGWYIYCTNQDQIAGRHQHHIWTRLQQPVLDYVPANGEIITLGTSMMMQATSPWQIWPYTARKYNLGWMTWIPFNQTIGHSYRALLRPNMYIFTNAQYKEEPSVILNVQEQMRKHYGVETYIRPICHNGAYALIQIRAVDSKAKK